LAAVETKQDRFAIVDAPMVFHSGTPATRAGAQEISDPAVASEECGSRRLQFAPKKLSVFCRFASVAFDSIAVTANYQPRRMDMRFISIFTHERTDRLPTEAEMASMGKLIHEAMEEGWLIATEGVHFDTTGIRVHKSAGGKATVTDGPFAETKEVLGGYALLKAASKEEVIKHTRRFLDVVGQGTCEIYQLHEMPTGEGE
jgi:hypothetical protein